ncbi:MAG: hypothetical protein EXS24_01035 [Pedosphaera sp.]|nr:hypothetical protein [Pedosphaera sp.]
MKTELHPFTQKLSRPIRPIFLSTLRISRLAASAFLCGLAFNLQAQTDNFDADTVTATGWVTNATTTYPAAYSFPADLFGGHAFRLRALRPAGTIGGVNTARVFAWRPDRLYTNFFVAADILAWGAPNSTNGTIFGIFGRGINLASGLGDVVPLVVEPNRWYKGQGSSRGNTTIWSLSGGDFLVPSAVADCTLAEGRAYRFVLTGVGNVFTGAIYDLEDLTRPVVSFRGDDRYFGLQSLWPTAGYSGIFSISGASGRADEDQTTDTTFDNFVASENAPTNLVAWPGTPHGLAGVAQVVNRSPISFTNFYPASSGITFNAATLTTTNTVNTNAIKLFLNGVNVSSGLSITGPTTNASVAYNGLASNVVYDARIELQDALGRKTTNAWTFDTFSDAYLASANAKNIEAEDWDYSGGQFINDPPVSGYVSNNISYPVNLGVGYIDKPGTANVDFQYYDPVISASERDFRYSDPVATQQGSYGGGKSEGLDMISTIDGDPADPSTYPAMRIYEVQRQKYYNATNSHNLQEYMVRHTEASGVDEWLNYTRVFTNTSYYNVYLRHACGSPQYLALDQVAPSTNNLGTFTMPSYTTVLNYRYVPLRDGSGKLAVVNLSGTNTLRLTVPLPYSNAKRYNLGLNYMAFVPTLLVESSSLVNGTYSIEPNATVEPGTRRVTVPAGGGTRFYRLRWDHPVTITSLKLVGGNVELTYQ